MATAEPKSIGRYRVERLLGAGGMGSVYLAEDPALKRRLAVKVVHAGAGQKEVLARFHREAEISARLNHPNVITIYDVGEDPDVGPFIAMEFIDGSSVAELVREGAVHTAEQQLRLLVPAMHAVEAAHAAGIVHRDIKPANLMVGRDGRVKLMDFGIARGGDSGLTLTGAVIGTPAYLAPEQLKGADPSESTDRYAFSVLAFELLTGTKPYSGPTTSTILYNIAHEHPAFPEGMSAPLRKVFERALAKEPSERYGDLKSFLAAVVKAAFTDRAERDRWIAALSPESALGTVAADEEEATIPAPVIAEGVGLRTVVLFGGAALAVVAAAGGALVLLGSRKDPSREVALAARQSPPAAVVEEPAALPTEPVSPPAATPVAAATPDLPPPTVAPPAQASASIERPVAAAEPTAPPPLPSPEEIRDTVVRALRNRNLTEVDVTVTPERRVVLANVRDAVEAERARLLAVRATGGEVPIEVTMRAPAPAPRPAPAKSEARPVPREPLPSAKPVWRIQREGSERTD